MAIRGRGIGRAERLASLAVLAALCALAAWMLAGRARLNPAVEVSLRAPAPRAGAATPAGPSAPAADPVVAPGSAALEASGGSPATLAALLPDAAPGLKALAPAESFTPVTLSDKIDGKAELYLSAGFAAMSCRSYQAQGGQQARVELYLYRMKSADAAFAVFSGQRRPGAASSGLAKGAYLTENALFLTSGAHYLEAIADRAGMRAPLEALAKGVLAGLAGQAGQGGQAGQDGGGAFEPADLFPTAGLKAHSLRLTVADAFGCQGLSGVYTAEYEAGPASVGGGATAFVARHRNAAAAAAQAALYRAFLAENGFAALPAPGALAGATAHGLEGVGVELVFTRGRFLAGVHEAPDPGAAVTLASALAAGLEAAPKAQEPARAPAKAVAKRPARGATP